MGLYFFSQKPLMELSFAVFTQTSEGKEAIQITLDAYKKYHGDSSA